MAWARLAIILIAIGLSTAVIMVTLEADYLAYLVGLELDPLP